MRISKDRLAALIKQAGTATLLCALLMGSYSVTYRMFGGETGPQTPENTAEEAEESGGLQFTDSEVFSKYGSGGEETSLIQSVLRRKGYYDGELSGVYTLETAQAVRSFQLDSGLSPDGRCGPATLEALGIYSPAAVESICYGSRGIAVRRLQTALFSLGYFKYEPDGRFRNTTLEAVKAYQSDNGFVSDGIVRRAMQQRLGLIGSESAPAEDISRSELDTALLASLIEAEAGKLGYPVMAAVGAVAVNRTRDGGFPDTLSGVIYAKGAFASVTRGKLDGSFSNAAYAAAENALRGADITNGALYYSVNVPSDGDVTLELGGYYFYK